MIDYVITIETTGVDTYTELCELAQLMQITLDTDDVPINVAPRRELGTGTGLQLDPSERNYDALEYAATEALELALEDLT